MVYPARIMKPQVRTMGDPALEGCGDAVLADKVPYINNLGYTLNMSKSDYALVELVELLRSIEAAPKIKSCWHCSRNVQHYHEPDGTRVIL